MVIYVPLYTVLYKHEGYTFYTKWRCTMYIYIYIYIYILKLKILIVKCNCMIYVVYLFCTLLFQLAACLDKHETDKPEVHMALSFCIA